MQNQTRIEQKKRKEKKEEEEEEEDIIIIDGWDRIMCSRAKYTAVVCVCVFMLKRRRKNTATFSLVLSSSSYFSLPQSRVLDKHSSRGSREEGGGG